MKTPNPRRPRGPQKSPTLIPVNLRIDRETLEAFRSTGDGYQRQMRETLADQARRIRRDQRADELRRQP